MHANTTNAIVTEALKPISLENIGKKDEIVSKLTREQTLIIIGNVLQVFGNSLQAIRGLYELEINNEKKYGNNKDGQLLEVLGSWIQAIGEETICKCSLNERVWGS